MINQYSPRIHTTLYHKLKLKYSCSYDCAIRDLLYEIVRIFMSRTKQCYQKYFFSGGTITPTKLNLGRYLYKAISKASKCMFIKWLGFDVLAVRNIAGNVLLIISKVSLDNLRFVVRTGTIL